MTDTLDMILFVCFFVVAIIGALLIFHAVGLAIVKFREWRYIKKRYPFGVPWWWRGTGCRSFQNKRRSFIRG